ncbi:ABC transporter permease [Saliterribacillus persicus]|uniref:Putative ABC transport system permease protein/putative ABC transport system permease protein n=1 Tax=Saliterribacillus persicus TaxID=930114 RepID=A0A368X4G8_9BACI|nr:ABC transporter permease [Saliterribacillus persicus]RCW62589.1 putative ABC transport system permease protein/putative ABC transport system permease protein [Saliterribacillus persicus]
MTFKQFAFNNVRRNARQYMSYFLSCTFSVAVFFIYAVILFHPEIEGNEFRESVQRGIMAAEIIIFSFSFLFVMYSTGAFIKSRKKEYGLLMTLGISKGQLNRLLIIENTIIGLVSILAGLLVGALFANVFLMGFSELLDMQGTLEFHLAPKAIIITVLAYFLMFEFNSLVVVWTLKTNAVIELFRGAKAPKRALKFSWILSILGLLLIGAAYYLAATATLVTIAFRMLPIVALIVPGTYFLFTQFSIAFLTILKRKKSFYFKQTNLLTISDLMYKMKDHARLLFFVTILSAVAFTASGVLYGAFKSAEVEATSYIPQNVSFLAKGEENIAKMPDEVQKATDRFEEENLEYDQLTIDTTQGLFVQDAEEIWVQILKASDYKKLLAFNGKDSNVSIADDEAYVMLPHFIGPGTFSLSEETELTSENNSETLKLNTVDSIVNTNRHTRSQIVVSDEVYENYASVAEENEMYRYTAVNVDNWASNAKAIEEATSYVDGSIVTGIDSQADFYLMMRESLSYTLFFGLFISVLFFLAAGSILYFKLYQDLDKDVAQYKALYRIGLTVSEMKKIATKQVAYLFFIPFFVAVVHASFAFLALQNMLSASVLLPSVLLIGAYFVIYTIYFVFIRGLYTAKIKQVM